SHPRRVPGRERVEALLGPLCARDVVLLDRPAEPPELRHAASVEIVAPLGDPLGLLEEPERLSVAAVLGEATLSELAGQCVDQPLRASAAPEAVDRSRELALRNVVARVGLKDGPVESRPRIVGTCPDARLQDPAHSRTLLTHLAE